MPLVNFFDYVLQTRLGPFVRQANPQLYPFILGALGISVLLGLANVFIERRRPITQNGVALRRMNGSLAHPSILRVVVGELIALAIEVLSIYLIWLAYATPLDQMPFPPPGAGTLWLGLPASSVYVGLAVTLHGALVLAGGIVLVGMWLGQLHTPDEGPLDYFVLLAGLALVIYSWEAGNWPSGYLIPAELVLLATVGSWFARLSVGTVFAAISSVILADPKSKEQFGNSVVRLMQLVGAATIVLAHPVAVPWVTVGGLYYTLTLIDSVYASFRGIFLSRYFEADPFSLQSTTSRYPITTALIATSTLAGAGGAFASVTVNPSVTPAVWLQAGSAALAYAIFKPLTTLALRKVRQAAFSAAQGQMKNDQEPVPHDIVTVLRQLPWLNFPGFVVFMVFMYLYALVPVSVLAVFAQINVVAAFNILISLVTNVLPRVLPLFKNNLSMMVVRLLTPAGVVSFILFLVTGFVIGGAYLLAAIVETASSPAGAPADSTGLLGNANGLIQTLLFLMIAGHILYLLQLVFVVLRVLLDPVTTPFAD